MQLYNLFYKKNLIGIFAFLFTSGICFLQTPPVTPVAPVMPIVPVTDINSTNMPAMPSINSQTQNLQNIYKPGKKITNQPSSTTNSTKQENKNQIQNLPESISDISSFIQQNGITANDLFSLEGQGLFTNLSSLNNAQPNNPNQNLVLNKILSELNEIKSNQNKLSSTVSKTKTSSSDDPLFLRFVINNQDILKSCKTIYFSSPENNGSFLVTGDVKSLFNSQVLQETFYMLFKTNGTENGKTLYQVELSLSQNFQAPESALYKFCHQSNLTAQQTGNLIVLRSNTNALVFDLLIDTKK